METISIERSIWINAPRERVWRALVDPEQVRVWFAPGAAFKSTGSSAGSRLYIEDPETGAEMHVQILEVVEPPHRLVLRSQVTPPDPAFVTSYVLDEARGGTQLTLAFSGYEGLPEEVRRQVMGDNAAGFERMLANIRAHVEGVALPHPEGF
ncbi:MAG: SRPBCC domain-containing protein [Anaerolineae bacterium]|nr:SRPBCC domain-containing protein [Anaerolineae bacterium]